ncbi:MULTISPECIES: replication initiation negative regulator SeqA [unclassified Colwellia]|jgi:negative modulator of initiation of replication|uniref:replication initiation negative regulator SeqA n=1 Tax=unclassified Colwellia TaxID=196834 RepID=UPI0015F4C437|nr:MULTISPECIES: replication initiation negative regulator SeqA [unclassified Colwellia]MBA6363596.1 replication initiation negative regulator SeqA [Colwellia sp. BRX8-8]MBA6338655.1 replication initiation negative regulator SeqA [Colwellia sp. BRX8-7]MBA6348823.1 replication initiation negative regulator SeqA [Colwellia sp. BRX8-9]MBA6353297.1 replication initiation negative regulator SeqA [Colwellia sp. BRX9-1]MBA6357478.1 replication initiation negative regulator SeqA [Colwellia sp. BRX8-3]|tara:strand:+ start:452 stop:1039 length:588 start_codon:yes stop_codon:yes gene_type:complete
MKNIEIDEELYQHIVSNTQFIGESASSILRRLLSLTLAEDALDDLVESVQDVEVTTDNLVPGVEENIEMEAVIVEEVMAEPPSIDNVLNYINKEELAMQRGAVGRFLLILAALYRVHSESFAVVSEIRGRDRLYFAKSKDELSASGSSTKPLQIPDSPFWVMTNSNTTRKKMMLTKASLMLGYTNEDAENIRDLL